MSNSKLEQFIQLCEKGNDGFYVSKTGDDYVNALNLIFGSKNINDRPFTIKDIAKQPKINDFKFAGLREFTYICDLKAEPLRINEKERINERIVAINFYDKEKQNMFEQSLGVAYLLTCILDGNEHIVKIGQSRTSFKKRLQSYNCGVVNNWRTASTTNIKILQSFVATREKFKLYILDCSKDVQIYDWHGVKSVPFASSKALAYEDILIKEFIKSFGKKPLANVQANASEID
jgi:hypothetical protein